MRGSPVSTSSAAAEKLNRLPARFAIRQEQYAPLEIHVLPLRIQNFTKARSSRQDQSRIAVAVNGSSFTRHLSALGAGLAPGIDSSIS
jgi:hypothetical protein